ncbi:hypothetical protein [Streptomyces spiralis]|uniref:hypothetical protein n=1 Tax=Streptomyces spiralis TaxID=66376 RepID=UPI00340426E4
MSYLVGSYLTPIEAKKHSKATGTIRAPRALMRPIKYGVDGQPDVVQLISI